MPFTKARCRSPPDGRGPFGRELKRILLDHGCRFVRHGKGDHESWISPITGLTFIVDAGTRKRFTANAILEQAGIRASEDANEVVLQARDLLCCRRSNIRRVGMPRIVPPGRKRIITVRRTLADIRARRSRGDEPDPRTRARYHDDLFGEGFSLIVMDLAFQRRARSRPDGGRAGSPA